MDVDYREILTAVQGQPLGAPNEELKVHQVSTDTRTLEKGDIFFALKGQRFDGHDFIDEALAKGARHFVVSDRQKGMPPQSRETVNFIWVQDSLKAYGDLARFCRQKYKIPAVAITGSCGKTTVKELIWHVLSSRFKVLKNRGTENNLVGVPKTIFQQEKEHEVLVLELGTSQAGEIDRLASIVMPQMGVVTQIGLAHLEGLKSRENIRQEKLKLVQHLERGGTLVLNGQDPLLADVQSGVHRVLRVGLTKENQHLVAERIWCHENGSSFYVEGLGLFETQLLGKHNILNCLFALAVANGLGLEFEAMQQALRSFKAMPGRLNPRNIEGIYFFDDSYNSNPSSFKAALETLKDLKIRERKGVICGDMLELGDSAEVLHREVGALIGGLSLDFVIAAGPLSKFLVDEALKNGFNPKRIHHVKNSEAAGKICRELAKAGDRILVKGSRGTQMEKVFECFITSSIL